MFGISSGLPFTFQVRNKHCRISLVCFSIRSLHFFLSFRVPAVDERSKISFTLNSFRLNLINRAKCTKVNFDSLNWTAASSGLKFINDRKQKNKRNDLFSAVNARVSGVNQCLVWGNPGHLHTMTRFNRSNAFSNFRFWFRVVPIARSLRLERPRQCVNHLIF